MRLSALGLLGTLALGIFVAPLAAAAPPQGHIPRLGVLSPNPPPPLPEAFSGLQQGLRELSYVEGQTIAFEPGRIPHRPGRTCHLLQLLAVETPHPQRRSLHRLR